MIENEKIEEMMLELEDASERAIDSLEGDRKSVV